jgi:hypothetical protein
MRSKAEAYSTQLARRTKIVNALQEQGIAGAGLEEMDCDSAPPHLDVARSAFRACSPILYPPQPHQVRTYPDFIAFEAGSPRGRQDIP